MRMAVHQAVNENLSFYFAFMFFNSSRSTSKRSIKFNLWLTLCRTSCCTVECLGLKHKRVWLEFLNHFNLLVTFKRQEMKQHYFTSFRIFLGSVWSSLNSDKCIFFTMNMLSSLESLTNDVSSRGPIFFSFSAIIWGVL